MHSIRRAEIQDFAVICDVWNTVWPHHYRGLQELVRDQEVLQEDCRPYFWLAEENGVAAGVAEVSRSVASYHPRRWHFAVSVLPDRRGKGVGSELYDSMLAFIESEGLQAASTRVNDQDDASIQFIQKRGYKEVKRDFESELELASVDTAMLREMGVSPAEIKSFAELDSPEFRREMHEVFETVRIDTPRAEPPTRLTLEQFETLVLDDPEFLPEGSRIALIDGQIAGFTGIYRAEVEGQIFQWLTGVKREHRGKGLAKAMKAHAAKWAIENGFRTIRTDNDTRNGPMLAINDRMGFRRLPGMITMSRRFGVEEPQ